MTVADAMESPLFAAMPCDGVQARQESPNARRPSFASGPSPLKLVSSNTEWRGVAARWKSVASSSSGTRTLGTARLRTAGSVYERIKSILLQRPWIPGELLQIGTLARELGTSSTPVREALVRLAAERLIVYAPKKGFLIKTIMEEELRGLYVVNQMYLQTALDYSYDRTGKMLELASRGIRQPSLEWGDGPTNLAFSTENLYLYIAAVAGIEEIVAMVSNVNDRLHRPRIAEFAVIGDALQEASAIADLFAIGEYGQLRQAIRHYHDARLRMAPAICKELLSMSFVRR